MMMVHVQSARKNTSNGYEDTDRPIVPVCTVSDENLYELGTRMQT